MNQFQKNTRCGLEGLARIYRFGPLKFSAVECVADPAIGHEAGDIYLRTTFSAHGRLFDAYIYNDEASIFVDQEDLRFELPDFANRQDSLRATFVEFVRLCVEGESTAVALNRAKLACGATS